MRALAVDCAVSLGASPAADFAEVDALTVFLAREAAEDGKFQSGAGNRHAVFHVCEIISETYNDKGQCGNTGSNRNALVADANKSYDNAEK